MIQVGLFYYWVVKWKYLTGLSALTLTATPRYIHLGKFATDADHRQQDQPTHHEHHHHYHHYDHDHDSTKAFTWYR